MWAKRQVDASITGNCHVGAGAIIFSRCGKDDDKHDNLLKSKEKEVGSHGCKKDCWAVGC